MAEYVVKSGDTLGGIAKQYGVPTSSITGYKSGNPNLIYSGERLNIGGAAPTTPGVPTAPGAPTSAVPGYTAIAQDLAKQFQSAVQPSVQALQAQIPTTQQSFSQQKQFLEGERKPLQERYQSLIDQITHKETTDISGQQTVTSREFGRRGIPLSSGVFEQTLQDKLSPIRQAYAGLTRDAGLSQADEMRSLINQITALPLKEQSALQKIASDIANIQSTASGEALNLAKSLYDTEESKKLEQSKIKAAQSSASLFDQLRNLNYGIPTPTNTSTNIGTTWVADPTPTPTQDPLAGLKNVIGGAPLFTKSQPKPQQFNGDPFGIFSGLGNVFSGVLGGFQSAGSRGLR